MPSRAGSVTPGPPAPLQTPCATPRRRIRPCWWPRTWICFRKTRSASATGTSTCGGSCTTGGCSCCCPSCCGSTRWGPGAGGAPGGPRGRGRGDRAMPSAGVEALPHAHLHGGPGGRQQHPDEEGPADVSVPPPDQRRGGGGGDGEGAAPTARPRGPRDAAGFRHGLRCRLAGARLSLLPPWSRGLGLFGRVGRPLALDLAPVLLAAGLGRGFTGGGPSRTERAQGPRPHRGTGPGRGIGAPRPAGQLEPSSAGELFFGARNASCPLQAWGSHLQVWSWPQQAAASRAQSWGVLPSGASCVLVVMGPGPGGGRPVVTAVRMHAVTRTLTAPGPGLRGQGGRA